MIGKSKPMQNLYALLDKIRNADSTILINGEMELVKNLSPTDPLQFIEKDKPFVIQNCFGI